MEVEVSGALAPIEIGATGLAEILQNVRVILSTLRGTVPLDRGFGLSATWLDQPAPEAMAGLSAEIVEAVERWETRARVVSVQFRAGPDAAMDGRLFPVVRISLQEDS